MRNGAIIGIQQSNKYDKKNKNQNHSKKKNYNSSQEKLSIDEIENLMKHSSYKRCRGGAIKQIK